MSDETLQSRLAQLEAENAELRKASKADIDRRAEQAEISCKTCIIGKVEDRSVWCDENNDSMEFDHYCKWWMHK